MVGHRPASAPEPWVSSSCARAGLRSRDTRRPRAVVRCRLLAARTASLPAEGCVQLLSQCLRKWGYRRCEDICWIKTNKNNPGKTKTLDPKAVFQRTKVPSLPRGHLRLYRPLSLSLGGFPSSPRRPLPAGLALAASRTCAGAQASEPRVHGALPAAAPRRGAPSGAALLPAPRRRPGVCGGGAAGPLACCRCVGPPEACWPGSLLLGPPHRSVPELGVGAPGSRHPGPHPHAPAPGTASSVSVSERIAAQC